MLETIITGLLNKYLSKFIHNLDPSQLDLSIFKGEIELEDLSVRPDILDSLPLPFKLHLGKVGKIKVDIPVLSLASKPIKIEIQEVFVILKIKSITDWNERVEIEAYQKSVASALDSAFQDYLQTQEMKKKSPGFFDKLLAKILDNLQISVTNLYIRLEDSYSYPQTPWALGVILPEASIATNNHKWRPQFVVDSEFTRKSFKIKDMSLLLNYGSKEETEYDCFKHYLGVQDLDRGGFSECKRGFELKIEQKQISILLKLIEYIGIYNTFQAGVLAPYETRVFSDTEQEKYCKLYMEYYLLFQNKKKEEAESLRKKLSEIEEFYSYEKLQILRLSAMKRYEFEEKTKEREENVEDKIEALEEKQKGGFFSRMKGALFGRNKQKAEQDQKELEALKVTLEAESNQVHKQEQKIFQQEMEELLSGEVDLDEHMLNGQPKEWARFSFTFIVPQISVVLAKDRHIEYLDLKLTSAEVALQKGVEWTNIQMSLKNIGIVDLFSNSPDYPYLFESVPNKENEETYVLRMDIKISPLEGNADLALMVKNEARFYIIANMVTIFALKQMVQEATADEDYDFSFYKSAAVQKSREYIQTGQQAMKKALQKQANSKEEGMVSSFALSLDIELNAPMILIPEDVYNSTSSCVAIDLGSVAGFSRMAQIDPLYNYKLINDLNLLCNCYTIAFQGFSIKVIERMQGSYREIMRLKDLQWDDTHALVDKFNFYLKVYDSVQKRNELMPQLALHLDFQDLNVLFTDRMLTALFKIRTALLIKLKQSMPEVKDKGPEEGDRAHKIPRSDTIAQLSKLAKINGQELKEDRKRMKELQNLRIDEQSKQEEEPKEEPVQEPEVDAMNQKQLPFVEIKAAVSNMKIYLADAYPNELESSAEYQYKLKNIPNLPNACQPLKPIVEINVEGVEGSVLITSHNNKAIAVCLKRFYIQDLQEVFDSYYGVNKIIAEPFSKIISSPQIEKQIYEDENDEEEKDYNRRESTGNRSSSMAMKSIGTLGSEAFFDAVEQLDPTIQASRTKFHTLFRGEHFFSQLYQLEMSVITNEKKNKTAVMFTFQWLRFVSAIPFFKKILEFAEHFKPPPLPKEFYEMEEEEKQEDLEEHKRMEEQIKITRTLSSHQMRKLMTMKDDEDRRRKTTKTRRSVIKEHPEEEDKEEDYEGEELNEMDRFLLEEDEEEKGMLNLSEDQKSRIKLMANKLAKMRVEKKKTKIIARGMIGEMELWLPFESTDPYSRVFAFCFQTGLCFKNSGEVEEYYDERTGIFLNSIDLKHTLNFDISIYELGLKMYNRHLLDRHRGNRKEKDLTVENLLNPSRLQVSFEQFFNLDLNILRRAVNVLIEPIDIQFGYRELDFFKSVVQKYRKFQESLSQEDGEEMVNQSIIGAQSVQQALEKQDNQNKEEKRINSLLKEEEPVIQFGERADPALIFTPATSILSVKFYCDCIKLSLRDDTGVFEYPVLNFNLSTIKTDALLTFNKPLNIVQLTLKMLCLNQQHNLKDPYLKVQGSFKMDANYFNMVVAAYEPLIEPWNLQVTALQEEEDTPLHAEIRLPDFININLTLGMAMMIQNLRHRVLEGQEEWEDEKELIKIKREMQGMHRAFTIARNEFGDFKKVFKVQEKPKLPQSGGGRLKGDQNDENEAEFQIENNTGVTILFWEANQPIDVGPKSTEREIRQHPNVFSLKPNQEMVIPTNLLLKIRNENRRKLGISDILEDDIICVAIKIPRMETLLRVPIQLAGTYAYPLTPINKPPKKAPNPDITFCVQTRPTGRDSKQVSFQSSILLSNNTFMSLRIFAITIQGGFMPSIDDTFDQINKEEAKEEVLTPNQVFRMPLQWILDDLCLLVQVSHNGIYRYEVLFGNLKRCFSQKEHKKLLETQMVGFNLDSTMPSRNLYMSCDVAAFKCLPTKDPKVPYRFLVNFNPPLCVENLFAELGGGLFCSIQGEELIRNAGKVERGQTQYFYDIEPYCKYYPNQLYFSFRVDEFNKRCFLLQPSDKELIFQSSPLKLNKKEEVKLQDQTHTKVRKELCKFEMYYGTQFSNANILIDDPMIYNNFELLVEHLPFNHLNLASENFAIQEKVFERTSAQKLVVFPDCQIVNQTQFQLQCGASKKDYHVRNSVVLPFSRTLYETSLNSTIALKTQGYNWSYKFSIQTIGISGALTLTKKDHQSKKVKWVESERVEAIKSIYKILNFGMKIEFACAPFSRTKVITIVPRFVIANNLDFPVIYRQNNNMQFQEYVPPFTNDLDAPSYYEPLYLPEVNDETEIQLRMAYPDEGEENCDPKKNEEEFLWSSGFSILDLEDFQVRFHRETEDLPKHWSQPSQLNDLKQYVRVEVTSVDDATIFICLNRPKFPDYTIRNRTSQTIYYQQQNTRAFYEIPKNRTVPYVWEDLTIADKKLKITVGGNSRVYNIDKIKIYKSIRGDDGTEYKVEMKSRNYTRCLEIREVIKEDLWKKNKLAASNYLQKILIKSQFQRRQMNLVVRFHGIGISVVDNEPRELLYASLYKFTLKLSQWKEDPEQNANMPKRDESIVAAAMDEEERESSSAIMPDHSGLAGLQDQYQEEEEQKDKEEIITELDLTVQHIQIDDMLNNHFPVIFSPVKPLVKTPFEETEESEEEKDPRQDLTPFIQLKLTKAQIRDGETYVQKYPGLSTSIQKMQLKIDHAAISNMTGFIGKLVSILVSDKKVKQVRRSYLGSFVSQSEAPLDVMEICPELKSETPKPPELKMLNANKIYFQMLNFGPLSINITLELEQAAFQIEMDVSKGFGLSSIFYTVGSSLANISNAHLYFQQIIILNTFSSFDKIMNQLKKNYTRQAVLQFYKLLGSSNLIGNPIGLVDKLGTGVIQFFSEPTKGMLKSPTEFVGGLGRGVRDLVTNVVSGSFDAVSNVTGSLYSMTKNLTGSKGARLKKQDHLIGGVYDGLKGGVTEIASGLAGLFTKPYQQAKAEGAKGFIKGLGAGVLGAIASPFTALFRIGFSLASGIRGTAAWLGGRRIHKLGRFRHPRYFNVRNVLLVYNDDYSEAKLILSSIKDGKFRTASLNFFIDVKRLYKKKLIQGVVIVTGTEVIMVESLKQVIFTLPLHKIKKLAVFEQKKNRYILYLWHAGRRNKFSVVENDEYPELDKLYSVLSPSIEK